MLVLKMRLMLLLLLLEMMMLLGLLWWLLVLRRYMTEQFTYVAIHFGELLRRIDWCRNGGICKENAMHSD